MSRNICTKQDGLTALHNFHLLWLLGGVWYRQKSALGDGVTELCYRCYPIINSWPSRFSFCIVAANQSFKNTKTFIAYLCRECSCLTPNAMLSKASCVIVYNEDSAMSSAGFGPKKKNACITETPDGTIVSFLFLYLFVLNVKHILQVNFGLHWSAKNLFQWLCVICLP